jgi:hypothetical protein
MESLKSKIIIDETVKSQLLRTLKTKNNRQLLSFTHQKLSYLKKVKTGYNHQLIEDAWSETLIKIKVENFLHRLEKNNIDLTVENTAKIYQYYLNLVNKMFFCNLVNELRKEHYQVSLDALKNQDNQESFLDSQADQKSTLTIDVMIEKETKKELRNKLQWIIKDPENCFKSIHLKNNPECNISELLKRRLKGEKWENIAQSFNLKFGTVTAFWFKKARPILKQLLQEFIIN